MKADLPPQSNNRSSASSEDETLGPALTGGSSTHSSPTHGNLETPSVAGLLPEQLPALLGRYELLRLLGRGGMGAVYLARDTQLDRSVALKVPFFTADDGPNILERFFREARSAATLQHASICSIYDVGEINGIHFLTMAYIEGRSLAEVLRSSNKPIAPRQAASLVRRVALALAEAHRKQIIHRDLKPGNIMLTRAGVPIVMDFGLARRCGAKDVRLTQSGMIMGTPAYMAPEQAKGNIDEMGPSCDIYSLGVILYELLTRQLPFTGDALSLLAKVLTEEPEPPSRRYPGVDAKLEAICLKALSKKPADRYATMTDFAAALADYLKNSDHTITLETPKPAVASSRRLRMLVLAVVAVLIPVLVVSILAYVFHDKGKSETAGADNPPAAAPPVPDEKDEPVEYVWPAEALRSGKIRAPDLGAVKPLLHDAFDNPASGFPVGGGKNGEHGYRDGKYFIQLNGAGYHVWRIPVSPESAAALKDGFACRIQGYTLTNRGRWGARLSTPANNQELKHLLVSVGPGGLLRLLPEPAGDDALAAITSLRPSAIKKGVKVSNSLLLITHGLHLEIYVNDMAVCDPFLLAQPVSPHRLGLMGSSATDEGATAEFTSVTVWPVDKLPSLRKRGAKLRPK